MNTSRQAEVPHLPSHNDCCGCSACFAVCSKKAISMLSDEEGFLHPRVDRSICVNCGKCLSVCPSLNAGLARKPIAVYAANAKDDSLRKVSSSGGVFSLLAEKTLSQGGVVFGAAFDHSNWQVKHKGVDNERGLADLRGSKYVQSNMGVCFKQVLEELTKDRAVLFSGTPCQVAGLGRFLEASHCSKAHLLLVDVVCHAVPSPFVWEKYLEKRLSSEYNERVGGLRDIRRISSRRKDCGWKRFSLSLGFANDKEYLSVFDDDPFMRAFLSELCNRPSCHCCPSKNLSSGADITIADYWGVADRFPEMDDDKGTSLVMINTEEGLEIWNTLKDDVEFIESDYEHACKANSAIYHSSEVHCNRNKFMKAVMAGKDFDRCVAIFGRRPLWRKVVGKIGRIWRTYCVERWKK